MTLKDRIAALDKGHRRVDRTLEGRIVDLENRVKELGILLSQHGEAVWDLQRIAGALRPLKKTKAAKAKGK